jgi:hypothetical protein
MGDAASGIVVRRVMAMCRRAAVPVIHLADLKDGAQRAAHLPHAPPPSCAQLD